MHEPFGTILGICTQVHVFQSPKAQIDISRLGFEGKSILTREHTMGYTHSCPNVFSLSLWVGSLIQVCLE